MKDYYKILQVDRTATPEEIKKSFRKLAKKFHPDVNKNNKKAEEVFKEINEAYRILSDENKKAEYDNTLFGKEERENRTGFQQNDFQNRPNRRRTAQHTASNINFQNTGSFFENFFGFNPNGTDSNKNNEYEKVRPMKTSEAYEHIFGKGRFR